MIGVTNLRNGTMFIHHGEPYKVLQYTHTKTARGGATVRVKSQNILNGVIKDITFKNNDKVEEANVINKELQFLYKDSENVVFMDMDTYEQVEIPLKLVENEAKFLIEGKEFQVIFYNDKPISIVLPASLYCEVIDAPPAVKGNTATNATKKIILENGMEIDAPQFIKKGDVVKINTTTGEYIERGNKR